MSRVQLLIFLVIFFVSIFLRVYDITNVPPGVNRDEASIAYTAYSLLETGKDEYGVKYPISFQSFGDWKLPFYIYATMPFVKVFGLSELAVRLPSVIFGIGSVILTFFFVKMLFKNLNLALLATFLIALSPWHIHLSRVESESNTAVFFVLLGLIFFLKSLKRNIFLVPSFIAIALTYYIYAGNYIFSTLLMILLFIIYRKQLLKNKFLYPSIIIFLSLFLFISWHTVLSANKTKLSGISIFGDSSIVHEKIELPRGDHGSDNFFSKVLHNRLIFGIERITHNYLNSYSADFLFIKGGGNFAHNIQNFGNMYVIETPFLFLGIILLLLSKRKHESRLILFWFLIAPITAVITKDAPHTNRMFSIFPALPIVVALGLYTVFKYLLKKNLRYVMLIIFLAIFFNIGIYLDRYFVHFPRNEAANWGLPYKKLVSVFNSDKYKSKKVIFSNPDYSHYIFLLFYSKYDPEKYQNIVKRYPPTQDKFVHVKSFDRFEFRGIVWSKDTIRKNTLLVDFSKDIPPIVGEGKYKTTKILLPNREAMFTIVETQ